LNKKAWGWEKKNEKIYDSYKCAFSSLRIEISFNICCYYTCNINHQIRVPQKRKINWKWKKKIKVIEGNSECFLSQDNTSILSLLL